MQGRKEGGRREEGEKREGGREGVKVGMAPITLFISLFNEEILKCYLNPKLLPLCLLSCHNSYQWGNKCLHWGKKRDETLGRWPMCVVIQ